MQPKTPNVYIQEKSLLPPSVAEVATAIPAFIGRTEVTTDGAGATLTNQPIRITSMLEFERWFGGPNKESFTAFKAVMQTVPDLSKQDDADATKEVIADIQRTGVLADETPKFVLYQAVSHFFANGGGACYVVSVGDYDSYVSADGDKTLFTTALKAVAKVDEVTLLVTSDLAARAGAANQADYYEVATVAIDQCVKTQDRFALIDTIDSLDEDKMNADMEALRNGVPGVADRAKYGAAYYPYLRTTMARAYDPDKVMISVPDPDDDTKTTTIAMSHPDLAGTAAYARLQVLLSEQKVILPPSAAMAGIYARVDGSRGVWKAPANVAISGVLGPVHKIDNDMQETMNVHADTGKSINAIRAFTGKGTLVWGARTLAGNDNEWRYVPVRRLFNMVEESVQKASGFAVFEPNTPFTWLKLKTMIESYLEGLWKQGALFGDTKEAAFFVNVGLGQTMTEADINNGIMNIEIGLAAVRPAEFIVLTFSHKSISG